jgi:hypothetical protein
MEATQRERAPGITLLYVRAGGEETELDRRVKAIAERYSPWVELRVVSPEQVGPKLGAVALAGLAGGSSALFLLRHGEIVGQAMGARLPARELDDVVRRAVEWPDGTRA